MWNLNGGLRFTRHGPINEDLSALVLAMDRKHSPYFIGLFVVCICTNPKCVTDHLQERNQ